MQIRSRNNRVTAIGSCGERGTILVPCVFMLSLMTLLTLSILKTGGIGSSTSEALAGRTQAHQAALSGVEIAYRRLVENFDYTGEQCWPLGDPRCEIDITVNALADTEFEIVSEGSVGDFESVIRTKARGRQWIYSYPLAVSGNLGLWGNTKVLGDCFAGGVFRGNDPAFVTGDVHLAGQRDIEYDGLGEVSRIDGYNVPEIQGTVHSYARDLSLPALDTASLRSQAAASGQVFTGTVVLRNREFDGVVYVEDTFLTPIFQNVLINGVLVLDDVPIASVLNGFLKIRHDPAVCSNVALLGPESLLNIGLLAEVDIYGLTVVDKMDFFGKGTFTGPFVAWDWVIAYSGAALCFQFPSEMTDHLYDNLLWTENYVLELEYEDL